MAAVRRRGSGWQRTVARDVEHIVDATGDPEIAVTVAAAAVTGEIVARVRLEVGIEIAAVVAKDGARDARPRLADAKDALLVVALDGGACRVWGGGGWGRADHQNER